MQFSPDRRRVLALGAAAGAALAFGAVPPATAQAQAQAQAEPVTLDQCLALTPLDMAQASPHATSAWEYLRQTVAGVRDADLRARTLDILANPAPSLLVRLDKPTRAEVYEELVVKGHLKDSSPETFLPPATDPGRSPQPFLSTPGSGYQSHHPYPGGLTVHTAGNMRISLAIHDAYTEVYGIDLDRDTVIVAQALHDLHKPWVFQWNPGGDCRAENTLAATGEHHVLGLAESIARGLPAPVVAAQACAHNHPGTDKDEAEVAGWIKAASIIAGVDPIQAGLLNRGGTSLPLPRRMEGFAIHLGDHDFVLTVPAAKWTIAALRDLARARFGLTDKDLQGPRFNALRNYVFSQATVLALYREYSTRGAEGLASVVTGLVRPA